MPIFGYIFCALLLLGAVSFLYALIFPGPVHEYPEGVNPVEPFKGASPEVEERFASDPLEDISYSSWKQNVISQN